jgi:CcmD family protein
MKAQWPVFALLAVSWIGIVAYLLVIGRRSRRIAELVDRAGGAS